MKKYRMLLVIVAIVIAILAVPVVANASHQWENYKWKSKSPVTLTIGDNVAAGWDEQLTDATSDGDASPTLSLT